MSATVMLYDGATLVIGTPSFVDPDADQPIPMCATTSFPAGKCNTARMTPSSGVASLDSEATGDNITLTIRYALENTPETLFLWPGCDGQKETCKAYDADDNTTGKFDNYRRFGGFPFIPTGNPSMVTFTEDTSGGKK